jgi:NADH-quinone oxidoreductase subunit N
MAFSYDNLLFLANLWAYMVIYNSALFLLLLTILQFTLLGTQNLVGFAHLGSSTFLTRVLVVLLFSMAGVPPFWGFFAKLFLFLILLNSSFFLLFFFFFPLLFIALYFYMQNLRFLNTSSPSSPQPVLDHQTRIVPTIYTLLLVGTFFLCLGFWFTEDLFLLIF